MLNFIIGPIVELIKTGVGGFLDNQKAKQRLKLATLETKLAIEMKRATADIDWDTQAMLNAKDSWKDEYLLLLFSPPLIMAFIPGLVPYVVQGFAALNDTPDWYKGAIALMVAASFGMRAYARRQMGMKTNG
jgi:hypothetical protein